MNDLQRFYRVLMYLRERKAICPERVEAYNEVVYAALHYAVIDEDEFIKYYISPAKNLPVEEITMEKCEKDIS